MVLAGGVRPGRAQWPVRPCCGLDRRCVDRCRSRPVSSRQLRAVGRCWCSAAAGVRRSAVACGACPVSWSAFLASCFLLRSEHHRHVATFEPGVRLDLGDRSQLFDDRVEDLRAELRVGHLAPTELQRHLHLVTVVQEVLHVPDLGVEVALADLRTELHFLDRHLDGLLARLLGLLTFLVAELAVVHDPAHWWVRHRSDLDEVEIELASHGQARREVL